MHAYRWLLLAAAVSAVVACDRTPNAAQTAETPAAEAPAAAAATSGIDLAGMDKSVKPGDDFDAYANGAWKQGDRDPRRPRQHRRRLLRVREGREAQRRPDPGPGDRPTRPPAPTRARSPTTTPPSWTRPASSSAAWRRCKPALAASTPSPTRAGLSRVLGASAARRRRRAQRHQLLHREPVRPVRRAGARRPVAQRGLPAAGRPGHARPRVLPRPTTRRWPATAPKYQAYIAAHAEAGRHRRRGREGQGHLRARDEDRQGARQRRRQRGRAQGQQPWPRAEFASEGAGHRLDGVLRRRRARSGQQTVIAWQPDAITKLSALVASEPLQTWKDYLALPRDQPQRRPAAQGLRRRELRLLRHARCRARRKQRDRWKRGDRRRPTSRSATRSASCTSSSTSRRRPRPRSQDDGRRTSWPRSAKRIDKLDWMTPGDQGQGQGEDRDTMLVGVGYPDKWRDYAVAGGRGATMRSATTLRAEAVRIPPPDRQARQAGRTASEWWMTPQTVNAVQPAAAERAELPGRDPGGAVLRSERRRRRQLRRHRRGDRPRDQPQLRQQRRGVRRRGPPAQLVDAGGSRRTSRPPPTKLVAQYDAYEALPGLHLNGKQTLGENIADVAGLPAAYIAYHKSLGGKPAPVIDGLTGDQRFFLAFAQAWRGQDARRRAARAGHRRRPRARRGTAR